MFTRVLLICGVMVCLGCSGNSLPGKVKAAKMPFNETVSIEKAFSEYPFFKKNGEWTLSKSPNNTEIVSYTADLDGAALSKTCDSFYFTDHLSRTKELKASFSFAQGEGGKGIRFYDSTVRVKEEGQDVRTRRDDSGELLKSIASRKPLRYCEWIFE